MSSKDNSTCILPRCESRKETFFKVIFTHQVFQKKQSRILKQKPFDGILSRLWRVLQIEYSKKAITRLIHIALEKFLF